MERPLIAALLLIKVVTTKIGVIALLLIGAVAYAAAGGEDQPSAPQPSPSTAQDDRPAR